MLADILKTTSPDLLAHIIRNNQAVIQATLYKFKAYRSFGAAMTEAQQMTISNNLNKLDEFFKSEDGKTAVSSFAEKFSEFVSQ